MVRGSARRLDLNLPNRLLAGSQKKAAPPGPGRLVPTFRKAARGTTMLETIDDAQLSELETIDEARNENLSR